MDHAKKQSTGIFRKNQISGYGEKVDFLHAGDYSLYLIRV